MAEELEQSGWTTWAAWELRKVYWNVDTGELEVTIAVSEKKVTEPFSALLLYIYWTKVSIVVLFCSRVHLVISFDV